jgi:chromosome partitioning protein
VHIIAIVNQKGGCGKTTTAINLAGSLAGRGFRTLLVDMDPQGHCAAGLAIPEQRIDLQIGDAMIAGDERPVDPQRLLWRVSRNLDLAPATVRLAAIESARSPLTDLPEPERRLSRFLRRFDGQYDACLIDCSPSIGMLAFNALVAARDVIIPVETGFFSLQGANKQINAIKALARRLGVSPVYRLLPTMFNPDSVLSRDLLDEIKRRFDGKVVPVVVRYDHALREAASFGQPVVEYSPESLGAQDYSALTDWIIEHILRPGSTPEGAGPSGGIAGGIGGRLGELDAADHASSDVPGMPTVHVVPGIAQRVGIPAPSTNPIVEPVSRAADVASRARRLQTRSDEASVPRTIVPTTPVVVAPIAEPAPAAPVSTPVAAPGLEDFGAVLTDHGVLFRQPAALGRQIAVAGEFNGWAPANTPLQPDGSGQGVQALVPLPEGPTQYMLVVDGQWITDPYNPHLSANPFGGSNSVVHVPSSLSTGGTHRRHG